MCIKTLSRLAEKIACLDCRDQEINGIQENKISNGAFRNILHRTPGCWLSTCLNYTSSQYTHKCNLIYVRKKSTDFAQPTSTKLTLRNSIQIARKVLKRVKFQLHHCLSTDYTTPIYTELRSAQRYCTEIHIASNIQIRQYMLKLPIKNSLTPFGKVRRYSRNSCLLYRLQ